MEWVETAGRTLAEAKDAALDQLGVDEVDAEFVIVSEPKVGLFGRTRGEARVRARVRPTQPRPKRNRERRTAGGRHRGGSGREATAADRPDGGHRGEGAAVSPAGTRPASRTGGRAPAAAAAAGGAGGVPGTGTAARRRRRGGRGGGRSGAGAAVAEAAGAAPTGSSSHGDDRLAGESLAVEDVVAGNEQRRTAAVEARRATEEESPMVEMSLEEQGEAARSFVAELVHTLGMAASVEARPADEETVAVAVEGDGVATLIGPGGTTLQALQELTRTYVQKLTGGQSDRILVDVAGYRARRVAALQRFTHGVAEEVAASGSPRALEPMSAADRKVVHDTVNDIAGVSTRSEGEDPRRYIVIVPDEATEAS